VRPLRDRDAKAVYTLDVRADVTVDAFWSVTPVHIQKNALKAYSLNSITAK